MLTLSRCFKCSGYSHIAVRCTNTAACGYCGMQSHETMNCENKVNIKCIYCVMVNEKLGLKYDWKHTVFNSNREVYKRKVEQRQDSVGYEFSKNRVLIGL